MASVLTFVTILLSLSCKFAAAGIIEACQESGALHFGKLSLDNVQVLDTKRNYRSKLECATECYADMRCMTAVYKSNGDCLLIKNFTNTLSYEDVSHSYVLSDEILEMRSTFSGSTSVQNMMCPSECTGYSVCFMDCTDVSDDADFAEVGCMDLSTTQYDSDICGFRPSIQSKEYYLSNIDVSTTSSGHNMFSVKFDKKYTWTTLQVKFRGTLRSAYGGNTGGWGRWKILFNNTECSTPGKIESTQYNSESDTDHYKASGINGICSGLSAGTADIVLQTYVGSHTSFRLGYATHASRLYVEEIGQPAWSAEPAQHPCPSLPAFNYREHTSTSEWGDEPSITLWNTYYTKMEADTWLRISLDMTLRQHSQGSSSSTCATWYIKINGEDCKPYKFGKTVANLNNANSVNNEHRSTEMEAHCKEVPAGYRTISLYLGTCEWGTGYLDTVTGWNGNTNRLVIEEFRPGTNVIGVMDTDGETVYKVPQFNMVAHGAGHIDDGTDEGEISWTIPVYNKIQETSGVRVLLSYDARVYWGHGDSATYDACCRHYIKFNEQECTDPGTIEGINYLNKNTNLHRPNLIEGICEGLPAGEVTLSIWAGKCKGYSKKGECFFGWNGYQHMLISESFVDREVINY